MKKIISMTMILLLLQAGAQDTKEATVVDAKRQEQAEAALKKATAYMLTSQRPDGRWGKYKMPAITALCATALHKAPAVDAAARDKAVDRGMKFVLSYVQHTGGIHGVRNWLFFKKASYPNYTTAITLTAMATINKPDYIPMMKAARVYLRSIQVTDEYSKNLGGFGYGPGKKPDMSNTAMSVEAMHISEFVDKEPHGTDEKVQKATKKSWKNLDAFLKKYQNLKVDEKGKTVSGDGGFAYKMESKLVSNGNMTYAGLKSMIYAKVDRKDPRVIGAMKFVSKHYTVKENPGQGMKGYLFYLITMAKALDAYGQDIIVLEDGTKANWRTDLIDTFLAMQEEDGSWVNRNGRFMESMPELATAYGLITIKIALKKSSAK